MHCNSNLANFRIPSFADDINVTLISYVTISALSFKQLYTFSKFYPINKYFYLKEFRI